MIDYHPADAILREAADLGADLIALGSHGHGGVRRLVIGSVADKVIRGATIPVFMMPAHASPVARLAAGSSAACPATGGKQLWKRGFSRPAAPLNAGRRAPR